MKKYTTLLLVALLSMGCNSQEATHKNEKNKENAEVSSEAPKGSWKVNKEFDEAGNIVRYDSIYSWSSMNDLDELATFDRDSVLQSMQSRFYRNFSQFDFDREGFGDIFAEDSLFAKHFFNNDFFENEFGKDFMDIDKMHERMESLQKQFIERYEPMVIPETEKDSENQKE